MSADQGHAWAAALGGLTGAQIAVGLGVLALTQDEQLKKWPPSAPEFRSMCENRSLEALGLPTEDQAYREACRNAHPYVGDVETLAWTHEAVCHAATETGFFNLNTLRAQDSRKLFARNYAIACRTAAEGKAFKSIPPGLPDPYASSGVRTPEVGRSALAGLRRAMQGAAS